MNMSSIFSSSTARRDPDAISRRAYEIWDQEGRPDGCDLRHWLQAEQELSTENAQSNAGSLADLSGNGAGNGNGRTHESTVTPASTQTSSLPDRETPPVPSGGKPKRSSTTVAPGKTTARGSTPKRKSTGSSRGPAL